MAFVLKELEEEKKHTKHLSDEIERLENELRVIRNDLTKYKAQIENQDKSSSLDTFNSTLAKNIKEMIKTLPYKSPLRKPILHKLINNIEKNKFILFFGISTSLYYKSKAYNEDNLLKIKYAIRTTRCKLSDDYFTWINCYLEIAMPVVSGRDYRLLIGTFNYFYSKYCDYMTSNEVIELKVSKSYLKRYLKQFKIRRVRKVDICPKCANKDCKLTSEELELHKYLAKIQTQIAHHHKLALAQNKGVDALIVQDFTQIQLSPSGFLQDYIIVVYKRDDSALDNLSGKYYLLGIEMIFFFVLIWLERII